MNNRIMFPALKNNAAAEHQGPVKQEILKGAVFLKVLASQEKNPLGSLDTIFRDGTQKMVFISIK